MTYRLFQHLLCVSLYVFSSVLYAGTELELEPEFKSKSEPFEDNVQTQYNAFIDIFQQGKPKVYLRLRNEHFHTKADNARDGQATTLQTRLGFETAPFLETSTYAELVHTGVFLKHRYNPGITGIGHPDRVVIPDPKGTGLTNAYAHFQGIDHTDLKFGRQYLSIDNKRFVHTSDFRHPRSVDGLIANTRRLLPDTLLQYAYLHQQNTPLSNTRHGDGRYALATHLLTAHWQALLELQWIASAYFHKNKTLANHSNKTYGLRVAGEYPLNEAVRVHYSVETAYQQGRYNNPNRYNASFFGFEAGATASCVSVKGGYDFLEGHARLENRQFQTPLGSKRKFRSWFDFDDPKEGVQDYYIKLEGRPYELTLFGAFHKLRYQAIRGTFAHVVDFGITKKLDEYIETSFQYSHMNAKHSPFSSGIKLWFTIIAKFG